MKTWHIISIVVGISLIGFGYYAISPLFKNVKVDEALPVSKNIKVPLGSTEKMEVTEKAQTSAAAKVIGTTAHPASGTARIVEVDGKSYLRYENFKTINGPDIYVYLAKNLEAKNFISLGKVKATEGNINYEIPARVNVAEYPYVLTWCRMFGVLFNYADLSSR